jgi:hypothetical protein
MGGKSSGQLGLTEQSIIFTGEISLANNGGFSSIRNPFANYDLSPFRKLKIRYRSVGQSFAMSLNNHRRFFMPKYKHPLPYTNGEWTEKTIRLNAFNKVRLGEPMQGHPSTEELSRIIRLGIISDDKKAGKFELEVDHITFE